MVCLRALKYKQGASWPPLPSLLTAAMLLSASELPFNETLVAEPRDYPEWRRGRSRYGVWMLPVDNPAVLARIELLKRELADLLHPSRRQPHITLFVCGFAQPHRRYDDDFTPAQLARQVAGLQALEVQPCTLRIGAVDSFASAAFLTVTDPAGQLDRWRRVLATECAEVRQAPYVPHLTLGLYRRRVHLDELRERLDNLPQCAALAVPVTCLEYATYEACDLFGPLSCQRRIYWQ